LVHLLRRGSSRGGPQYPEGGEENSGEGEKRSLLPFSEESLTTKRRKKIWGLEDLEIGKSVSTSKGRWEARKRVLP